MKIKILKAEVQKVINKCLVQDQGEVLDMWLLMEGFYPQCSSRQGSSPKGMSHIVKDILEWFFSHAWEVSLLTKYTCKLSCQLINASVALTWNTRDFRLNDKTGIVWSSLWQGQCSKLARLCPLLGENWTFFFQKIRVGGGYACVYVTVCMDVHACST